MPRESHSVANGRVGRVAASGALKLGRHRGCPSLRTSRGPAMIALTVNGRPYRLDIEPETPLLWVIRDEIGLTGTKFGCGIAQCGACTVHVNGKPVRSCQTPLSAVEGK